MDSIDQVQDIVQWRPFATRRGRVQLQRDGTPWRKGRKWRGNWQMEWAASTLHTTSELGVFSLTTADAHTSASSSLNWRPRRFKWIRPFRRKTKSGFCACAITFQTPSNSERHERRETDGLCFSERIIHRWGSYEVYGELGWHSWSSDIACWAQLSGFGSRYAPLILFFLKLPSWCD